MYKVNKVDLKKYETVSERFFESLRDAKEYAQHISDEKTGAFVLKVEELIVCTVNI